MNFDDIIKQYRNIISGSLDRSAIKDDLDFKRKNQDQLYQRDKIYTEMLELFQNVYSDRQKRKENHKWKFFFATMIFLGLFILSIVAVFIIMAIRYSPEQIGQAVPVFVAGVVGVISALIAIPLTIAQYLFNPHEDTEISQMIIEMQKHDLTSRNLIWGIKDVIKRERETKDTEGAEGNGASQTIETADST